MILRKVYNAPIAERFAIEEDGRLLENSEDSPWRMILRIFTLIRYGMIK